MTNQKFREDLIDLLTGGQAHQQVKKLVEGLKFNNCHVRPPGCGHSIYEILEHLRLAQEDIYQYTVDESWKSPPWPEGYWPTDNNTLTEEKWNHTVSGFLKDLEIIIGWVKSTDLNITNLIPHGEGRTYLRQILLVADHNSYHLGQMMLIKKILDGQSPAN